MEDKLKLEEESLSELKLYRRLLENIPAELNETVGDRQDAP